MLLHLLALVLLSSASSLGLDSVAVFRHGEGGYPCIRIPAITQCRGLLHAFAECRTRIGDGCLPTAGQPHSPGQHHVHAVTNTPTHPNVTPAVSKPVDE